MTDVREDGMMPKPILFSTPMVRAILDGRKTQTRRVAKAPDDAYIKQGGLVWYDPMQNQDTKRCPRYQPDDILWVRETWFSELCRLNCPGRKDSDECPFNRVGDICYGYKTQYANEIGLNIKWKPSIHMPREAARIFLRVTDVRAERLNDITEEDAISEGIIEHLPRRYHYLKGNTPGNFMGTYASTAKQAFMWLWNDINTKKGFTWASNPWVWAYTFERCEMPEGWLEMEMNT